MSIDNFFFYGVTLNECQCILLSASKSYITMCIRLRECVCACVCARVCLCMCSPGAVAVPFAMYGEGQGNILLDNVGCQGTETSLEQCPHRGYYIHNCQPYEDVGVICNNRKNVSQWML